MTSSEIAFLPPRIGPVHLSTDAEKVHRYARLSGDFNPLHIDPEFAARTPFGGPIVHGAMTLGLLLRALEENLGSTVRGELDVRFLRPVPVGAEIIAMADLDPAGNAYHVRAATDDGHVVIEGRLTLLQRS